MRSAMIVLSGAAFLLAPVARTQDVETLRAMGKGRALYLVHCTECHGVDAKGGVVGTNDIEAPDLTLIEVRDGVFSTVHVANHVSGRHNGMSADRTMPVWVAHFKHESPMGDGWAQMKVMWLSRYLESIQETNGPTR